MKTKHILHLVTFVLTFAVSVTVAGAVKSLRGLSTGEKITNVLSQDINNGFSRRQQNCRRGNFNLAYKTNEYVNASSNLDVSDLPSDFRIAWQNHMQAWRIHSNYLTEVRNSGDFDEDYDEVSSRQINEINRTWYEVIRIARIHGAVIPQNAFY